MLLATLLSATLCAPPALPVDPAARTEAFWVPFLNGVLHDCFGSWHPVIQETPVSADPIATMAGAMFTFQVEGAKVSVLAEPAWLAWVPSSDHVQVVFAHEAVHIALFGTYGMRALPDIQEELVADTIAATSIPHGACRLVETYQWHLGRLKPEENIHFSLRTEILKTLCKAQQAIK